MRRVQFQLPDHVFACIAGEHCVFLDLRRDEYSCLHRCDTSGFATMVEGWPAVDGHGNGESPVRPEDLAGPLNELVKLGLLAPKGEGGRKRRPVDIPKPLASFLDGSEMAIVEVPVGPDDVGRFFTAIVSAAVALRWSRLENVVRRFDRRKTRGERAGSEPDLPKARELVSRFRAMRLWVPRRSLCLFDSLAMLEFFARYGLFPTWVFGVRTAPFRAHCWVQAGEFVLNDTVEHVRPFTPIMAV